MTWNAIIRRYPSRWIIFEVLSTDTPEPDLRVLETDCEPHTIIKQCNDLAHAQGLARVSFAHTSWDSPFERVSLRTLPTGHGIAL
jgi:hypothetical protein